MILNTCRSTPGVSLLQRFWKAGGSSLTVRSPRCCCSLWGAKLSPVEKKVRRWSVLISHLKIFFVIWCALWSSPWISSMVYAFAFSGVEMEGYNLLVTSTIETAVVYRSESDKFLRISAESSPGLLSICACVFSQRRPGARLVSACVPLRERSVGRSALCSGHWPGFWRAEGGAVGNVWAG